jgi:hypothetical protein
LIIAGRGHPSDHRKVCNDMSELVRRHNSSPAKKAPAMKAAAEKAPAKKAVAKKAPAKKAAAKKAPAKKAVAKKAPAKKAPPKRPIDKKAPGAEVASKDCSAKRHARPTNRFKGSDVPASHSVKALPAPPDDPHLILGLTEPYTQTELRRSWRAYATRHHPDQGGDAFTFARGQAAYENLTHRFS